MATIRNTTTGELSFLKYYPTPGAGDAMPDIMAGWGVQADADSVFELDAEGLAWWVDWAEVQEKVDFAAEGLDPDDLAAFEELGDLCAGDLGELQRMQCEFLGVYPRYQRCELEAFLGDPDGYDVDAIESAVTYRDKDGNPRWAVVDVDKLASICAEHALSK